MEAEETIRLTELKDVRIRCYTYQSLFYIDSQKGPQEQNWSTSNLDCSSEIPLVATRIATEMMTN
jgi:hypothetical protein